MIGWFSAEQSQAGMITAATYNGGGTFSTFANATGFFFTPNVNISVDRLGYFDENQDGLASAHDVGIFLENGTPVTTTTILSGVGSPLIGQNRFEPITPMTLTASTPYYIVANNNTIDQFVFGTTAVSFTPQITWNGFGDATSNSIFSTVSNRGG